MRSKSKKLLVSFVIASICLTAYSQVVTLPPIKVTAKREGAAMTLFVAGLLVPRR